MTHYTTSSCPIVTVLAERRYAPNEGVAGTLRRYAERVQQALVDAGVELDSVPSGHYPHVEVPELTAERFSKWLGS